MDRFWTELLKTAEEHPYDSSAWTRGEAEEVSAALTRLAEQKRTEAAAAVASAGKLVELIGAETEWRSYFAFGSPAQWTLDRLSAAGSIRPRQAIEAWLKVVARFRELRTTSLAGITEATDLGRLAQLEELRVRIHKELASIDALFLEVPVQTRPDSSVTGAAVSSNAAEVDDLHVEIDTEPVQTAPVAIERSDSDRTGGSASIPDTPHSEEDVLAADTTLDFRNPHKEVIGALSVDDHVDGHLDDRQNDAARPPADLCAPVECAQPSPGEVGFVGVATRDLQPDEPSDKESDAIGNSPRPGATLPSDLSEPPRTLPVTPPTPDGSLPTTGPVSTPQVNTFQPLDVRGTRKSKPKAKRSEGHTDDRPQGPPRLSPEEALARYLEHGDAGAAYWIARAFETRGADFVDPSLLALANAAIQPLAGNDTSELYKLALDVDSRLPTLVEDEQLRLLLAADDDSKIVDERNRQDASRCLRIAATLQPLLFSEFPFPQPMLQVPVSMPWIGALTNALFELFSRVGGHVSRESWVQTRRWRSFQIKMRTWEDSVRSTYIDKDTRCQECSILPNLPPSIEHLLSSGQELRAMADIVLRDQWERVDDLRELQRRWRKQEYVADKTWQVTREVIPANEMGRNWSRLFGGPLRDLSQCILEGCDVAVDWCAWVDEPEVAGDAGDYRRSLQTAAQSGQLFASFLAEIEPIRRRLSEYRNTVPGSIKGPITFLKSALDGLANTLRSVDEIGPAVRIRPFDLLAQRLLWHPNIQCDRYGHPLDGQTDQILAELDGLPVSADTQEAALEEYIDRSDLRAATRLADLLPQERRAEAMDEIVAAHAAINRHNVQSAAEIRKLLERQRADGWISETDYALYRQQLNEVESGSTGASSAEDVASDLKDIGATLAANSAEYLAVVSHNLRTLRERLGAVNVGDAVRTATLELLNQLQKSGATREVAELAAQLHGVLDEGHEIETRTGAIVSAATDAASSDLEEFLQRSPAIEVMLRHGGAGFMSVLHQVRDGYVPPDLGLTAVPAELLAELDAWDQLRRTRDKQAAAGLAGRVLSFLGFQRSQSDASLTPTAEFSGRLIHLRASRSVPSAPTPEFGSKAHENYRIAVATEALTEDDLLAQLRDDQWPHFLFYCGALSLDQRRSLGAKLVGKHRSTLVIDDVLLLHLAGRPLYQRLTAMFLCALPFGCLNPYNESESVAVAPEMFFGRRRMASQIRGGTKNILLYGGRQLGKSALLMNAYRESERDPDVIPIHHVVGDDPADSIWGVLDSRLRKADYIKDSFPRTSRESVESTITAAAAKDPRRVLILLDEADHFLREELRTGTPNLNAIRRIHTHAGNRFRVVLAGNYSLLRYAHLLRTEQQNSAAELYEHVVVGPLEFADALDLIRRPLEALGYRFQGESGRAAIHAILDYTFCQAGLLQLFLHHLVSKLRRRPGAFPVVVRPEDVEEVAQGDEQFVLKQVSERFRMTVRLDVEYELILISLLLRPDRSGTYLDAGEIRSQLESHWPDGIATVLERFGGSMKRLEEGWLLPRLREMVGLGVLLERKGQFGVSFSVRTDSLRRLYGSEGLRSTLDRLKREEPTEEQRIESWHPTVDGQTFSVFNSADLARLASTSYVCATVAGAAVSGGDRIPEELDRIRQRRSADEILVPKCIIQRPADLTTWFREAFVPQTKRDGRYYVLQDLDLTAASALGEFQRVAVEAFGKQTHQRLVGVWFRLNPCSLYEAVRTSSDALHVAADVQGKAGVRKLTLVLGPWELEAIRARLYEQRREPTLDDARSLMKQTAGWPYLLDLFDGIAPRTGMTTEVEVLWQRHLEKDSRLKSDFLGTIGLLPDTALFRAFGRLIDVGGCFLDEVQSEFELAGLTTEQERTAALHTLRLLRYIDVEPGDAPVVSPDPLLERLWKLGRLSGLHNANA
jgi:hypothetical protein